MSESPEPYVLGKSYALGEIEALCKKAACGSGMAWGMAEEAAKAVKFLSVYDLPATKLLAQVLRAQKSLAAMHVKAQSKAQSIESAAPLCPIAAGVATADRASCIGTDNAWQLSALYAPLLALPLLWRAAVYHNKIFHWHSDELQAYIGTCGFAVSGTVDTAQTAHAEIRQVKQVPVDFPEPLTAKKHDAILMDAADEKILRKFFLATTVPETEASRLHGAGAGLSDND